MNRAPLSRRGPAGRRAVAVAGLACVLAACLYAVESSDGRAPAMPRAAGQAGTPQATAGDQAAASSAGTRLLAQAATAARVVPYQGVQVITWLTPGGNATWLSPQPIVASLDVRHRADQLPEGVLGLTPALVGLLRAHYAVIYAGPGRASGRSASVVEVLRRDGTVAARFWLDRATKLPLRRELFDTRARLVSIDNLAGLRLITTPAGRGKAATRAAVGHPAAAAAVPGPLAAGPQRIAIARVVAHDSAGLSVGGFNSAPAVAASQAAAGSGQPASPQPWADRLGRRQLAALRADGWPAPGAMPGGLTLFEASESQTASGKVVDLAYSDGLSVVSLFVERGQLPAALPGWRRTSLDGRVLYLRNPAEPDLTWSAGGYVFTVVAGAPAATVASVVDSLPRQGRMGFWKRMGCGVRRLLSWVDPFR